MIQTPENEQTLENEQGFALTEIGFAAVIVALLIIGGVIAAYGLLNDVGRQNSLRQLNDLSNAVQKIYSTTAGDYGTGSLNGVVESFDRWPSNMDNGGGNYVHALKGPVNINGAGAFFEIAFSGLEDGDCADLSTQNGGGPTGSLDSIDINGSTVTLPVLPTVAASECSQGGSGNTIVWRYR